MAEAAQEGIEDFLQEWRNEGFKLEGKKVKSVTKTFEEAVKGMGEMGELLQKQYTIQTSVLGPRKLRLLATPKDTRDISVEIFFHPYRKKSSHLDAYRIEATFGMDGHRFSDDVKEVLDVYEKCCSWRGDISYGRTYSFDVSSMPNVIPNIARNLNLNLKTALALREYEKK